MKRSVEQVRWDLAQRYRLIETIAWWEGRLTTHHLMQSFGISRQQASKDINAYLNEHAPANLVYDKRLKGYKPGPAFEPLFIDGSASAYLHLLDQNRERAPHLEGLALAYAHTEVLRVPDRSVRPEVLRPILQACREGLRLETEYVSLSSPEVEIRVMVPHTLVFTGMRWHVRAYCEKHGDYRDFVLSRFRGEPDLIDGSDHGRQADEAWNTEVDVVLVADSRLSPAQRDIIATDYGMQARGMQARGMQAGGLQAGDAQADGTTHRELRIATRGALVQYVLQRYQIDTTKLQAKAEAQQLVVANLEALRRWLYV